MRWAVLALLVACDAGASPSTTAGDAPPDGAPARVRRLVEDSRWKEVGPGHDPRRTALAGGGWSEDAAVFDRDGAVVWSGHQWAQRYGRFGSAKAFAVSEDGRVIIADGADSPSACLCDRDRGTSGSSAGALVRLQLVEGRAVERVLEEHGESREYVVAASTTAVAAAHYRQLSVWPAHGDGPPVTVELDGPTFKTLAWAGDRYLVATRYVELDRTDVVVLDRDAGWKPRWTWPVAGTIHGVAVRPGGGELALAVTRYRATDVVHVDERWVAVLGLDGARHAARETVGYPTLISWSRSGDALLVATAGSRAGEQAVIRYRTR